MDLQYSIRINFDEELMERPERVFEAMGLYVKGFNGLYTAFVKGVDHNLNIQYGLRKTRDGSLIADVGHILKDKTKHLNIFSVWDGIYRGLEKAIVDVGKIDSEGDVKSFVDNVNAQLPDNDSRICECDANLYEVAKNLKLVFEGMQKLSPNETTEFGINDRFHKISPSFNFPRAPDELFEDKIIPFPSRDLLTIKRPDYVGNAQWDFLSTKRKSKKISAKILDEIWMNRWRNHEVQFWPGDALLVKIITRRYVSGTDGVVSYKDEIINVLDVISQDKIEQALLDLKDE
ncbi:TPA: hypothetical protein ACM94U_002558 [Escherichia coli]